MSNALDEARSHALDETRSHALDETESHALDEADHSHALDEAGPLQVILAQERRVLLMQLSRGFALTPVAVGHPLLWIPREERSRPPRLVAC